MPPGALTNQGRVCGANGFCVTDTLAGSDLVIPAAPYKAPRQKLRQLYDSPNIRPDASLIRIVCEQRRAYRSYSEVVFPDRATRTKAVRRAIQQRSRVPEGVSPGDTPSLKARLPSGRSGHQLLTCCPDQNFQRLQRRCQQRFCRRSHGPERRYKVLLSVPQASADSASTSSVRKPIIPQALSLLPHLAAAHRRGNVGRPAKRRLPETSVLRRSRSDSLTD